MYEEHWGLVEKPFENTSDTRFYYPSEAHQGALLKLRYAVENRRGAAVLAGAAGLGKTLLVQTLARQRAESCSPFVHVVFPQMPPDQLLAFLADELTGQKTNTAALVSQSVRALQKHLAENARAGRHAVLVLDEAQLLREHGTLETVRLLLNFEADDHPALTVLLVGQPPLLTTLDRQPELDARVGVKCLIRPFTLEETIGYVRHRFAAAGARREIIEPEAVEAAHYLSRGVARHVNRLCDLALLIGYAEERPNITAQQIEAVAEELVAVTPE